MSELKKYRFSDLYEMSSGISTTKAQSGHGSPFLSFSSVFNNYFVPEKLNDLMDTSEKEQETYSIQNGDIFLTRTSEVIDELGMSSVAIKDYPNATFSGFLKRLRPTKSKVTYPKYMAFYLRSQLFRKTMTNNAVMTLRASLNEAIFSYFELFLPEYDDQVKAGDLLFLMNQKIELNNRINAELEAMAKTLYDYWFVQFDFPDANGKPYKTSGGKMVYNAKLKREIPEGWVVKKVGDYADVLKGDLITAKDTKEGDFKVVAAGVDFSYTHADFNRAKNTITISGSGANAGFINFWREPIFASDCITVRGATDTETLLLLHHLSFIQNHILNQATGSAQPHVYPSDIRILDYAIPKDFLIDDFGEFAIPMNNQIAKNSIENQLLVKLRDWLLPMLMNGQVTVR
jgi:type I restriction enzyme S subunit